MAQTWYQTFARALISWISQSNQNDLTLQSTFEGETPPANPVNGQKWYQKSSKITRVFTGSADTTLVYPGWEEDGVNSTQGKDLALAKGTKNSLAERLATSMNDDGTLKAPATLNVSEWVNPKFTLAYVSNTQFTVSGNQTDIYTANRAIKATLGTGMAYSFVDSSAYDSVQDKTTVTLVDAILTTGLQKIEHGIIQNGLPELKNMMPKATTTTVGLVKPGQGLTVDTQGALSVANVSAAGLTGYIAEGLNITPGTGLNVNVATGRSNIGEKVLQLTTAATQSLDARMTALMYHKSDGTIGKANAVSPLNFIDNNTVGMWIFNQTAAGASIPNSAVGVSSIAVANNLAASGGLTSVDGWLDYAIKGDGSSGYYQSANYTGFPIGAAERELDILVTVYNASTNAMFAVYGSAATDCAFGLCDGTANTLQTWHYGDTTDTGYSLDNGKTYLLTLGYDGSNDLIYVNGNLIAKNAKTLNTTASVLKVLTDIASSQFGKHTIQYIELRNKMRTAAQIAKMANQLCLPCFYAGYSGSYPTISTSDQSTAYHEWKSDETSGTTVADTAGTLNGTATGTTVVDSGIGLGKARKFNGTTDKILFGNFQFSNNFTIIFCGVLNQGNIACIFGNLSGTSGNLFYVQSDVLTWYKDSTAYVTTTKLTGGVPVFLAITVSNGTVAQMYANSSIPETISITVSAVNQPSFSGYNGSTSYGNQTQDYLAYFPRTFSQAEIAVMYNALMNQGRRNIIDDILPTNAVSLGFARTNSSAVIEINDSDYKYGRREGAVLGNRRKFLGWRYFNTGGTAYAVLDWNNPFGTRKIAPTYKFSQDANGMNESPITGYFYANSADYGVNTQATVNSPLSITVNPKGASTSLGALQTSGYIGCYAEVLE